MKDHKQSMTEEGERESRKMYQMLGRETGSKDTMSKTLR